MFIRKAFENHEPVIPDTAYVANSAEIVGSVVIGEYCSIWSNAVIRADINSIAIGEMVNVQECCIIHVETERGTIVGNGVTIGHGAILHACTIEDFSMIGIGAIVLDGVSIGNHCIVAAGSVVPPGKTIPPRSMVMGTPGKIVRTLSDDEALGLENHAKRYRDLAKRHKGGK